MDEKIVKLYKLIPNKEDQSLVKDIEHYLKTREKKINK